MFVYIRDNFQWTNEYEKFNIMLQKRKKACTYGI